MQSHKLLLEHWREAKRICKERSERGEPEFPTGLKFLDNLTGGFRRGEIWIVAGKSGSGKTSLALNLAREFSENRSHSILFLTLEMKGWQLALRMYAETMRENYSQIEQGQESIPADKDILFEKFITGVDFEIVEYGYSWNEVLKIFGEFYKQKRPDVIFLDYIQLVESAQQSRQDERAVLSEYIRKIKEWANRYNIGFVVVSQLRRLPSGADYNRPPDMIDLFGSGSLEQTADKVLLIYKTIEDNQEKHYINLAKNRQGRTITQQVKFIGEQYRFEDIPENMPAIKLFDNTWQDGKYEREREGAGIK